MDRVNILGVKVDKYTVASAAEKIMDYLGSPERSKCVYTPNSEIIMAAYKNPDFCDVLNRADILTADGIGVVYASRILRNPIASRAAGYDIACEVLAEMSPLGMSVYLFGAKPGVAQTAAANICKKYPGIKIAGCSDGYFDDEKEKQIIADINENKPDMLFVCLGAPKQELWIDKHKGELDFGVCMGIGGSLDVFAGTAKRAPKFFQRLGLEWFYRLLREPKRFIRMMDLPKFGFTVLLKGRKFKQER